MELAITKFNSWKRFTVNWKVIDVQDIADVLGVCRIYPIKVNCNWFGTDPASIQAVSQNGITNPDEDAILSCTATGKLSFSDYNIILHIDSSLHPAKLLRSYLVAAYL